MSSVQLEQRLRDREVRPTRQRLAVLRELAKETNDATATVLWQRIRKCDEGIGLATVYRTLSLLEERGIIDSLSHHAGERCFRLCSDAHHHHLVCEKCHRVVEIEQCDVGRWVDEAAERHGFTAREHSLEIAGVCSDCR